VLKVPAITTGVLLGALLVYWLIAVAGEHRKLQPVQPLPEARANYRITLDFPPERFHQLLLQEKGRLVGVHGNVVDMMDVEPSALRDIASRYWVASVDRWSGP
jgi:hypothetical protein